MAALSDNDMKVVRSRVGDGPSDEVLDERYDRLGSVDEVIRETLAARLASLLDRPDTFNVPGEYGESRGGQIKALQDELAGGATASGVPQVRVAHAERPPCR
jgi:hypothetical protein